MSIKNGIKKGGHTVGWEWGRGEGAGTEGRPSGGRRRWSALGRRCAADRWALALPLPTPKSLLTPIAVHVERRLRSVAEVVSRGAGVCVSASAPFFPPPLRAGAFATRRLTCERGGMGGGNLGC